MNRIISHNKWKKFHGIHTFVKWEERTEMLCWHQAHKGEGINVRGIASNSQGKVDSKSLVMCLNCRVQMGICINNPSASDFSLLGKCSVMTTRGPLEHRLFLKDRAVW